LVRREVSALAFVRQRELLASANGNGTVTLTDMARGQVRATLQGHAGKIYAVAFTRDGRTLATGSADKTVKLWDVASGQEQHHLQGKSYSLLLHAAPSPAAPPQDPSAAPSFDSVRSSGGSLRMEIRRNGVLLREQAVKVGDGPLRLFANREGDRLTFKINELQPLVFEDTFPLGNTDSGVFGLYWPQGVGLERLSASHQPPAIQSSPLERGDVHYSRGQFTQAIDCYQAQTRATAGTRDSQEPRCKDALCLVRLERYDEAVQRLLPIASEPGERWPLVASCQLWLIYLQQNRSNEANEILDRLCAHYRFAELAVLVPDEDRTKILEAYRPRQSTYSVLKFDPNRVQNLKRIQAVEELFNAAPEVRNSTTFCLVQAYFAAGQNQLALSTAEELLRSNYLTRDGRVLVMDYVVWLHLRGGEPKRALQEVDRWLVENPGVYRPEYMPLLLERARVYAAMQEWRKAEEDLEAFLHETTPDRVPLGRMLDACLLRGFLRERRGDAAGALAAWRDGYLKVKGTGEMHRLNASILASLANELTAEDARKTVIGVFATTSRKFPVFALFEKQLVPLEEVTITLREMWRTPRGRAYARKIAFCELPYAEHMSAQVLLSVAETIHQGAFPGELSREHEELIWKLVQDLYAAYQTGRLKEDHFFQIVVTYTGTTNQWGWDGVSRTLDPDIRGPLAYCFGHLYRRRNKPADSAKFFATARDDARATSTLRRLAQAELDRLKAK
jgi:tetratricopeptide (TPR) repeat protein